MNKVRVKKQQVIGKADFIQSIEDLGFKKVDAEDVVNSLFTLIESSLLEGKRVQLVNIGTIIPNSRKKTTKVVGGVERDIPERFALTCKTSKNLNDKWLEKNGADKSIRGFAHRLISD